MLSSDTTETMKRDWLNTEAGTGVVAVGLVAIVFSLILFCFQDISILLTGKPLTFGALRNASYMGLAVTAALFSALTLFLWRGAVPRVLIGLFSVSMLSHIVEQFVTISAPGMKMIAFSRIVVALGLVLLFLQYRRSKRAANS